MATGDERLAHLRAMTRSYRGDRYFLPVLPPMKQELHPLMAWWAVLYALSMLFRYQPAKWNRSSTSTAVSTRSRSSSFWNARSTTFRS